MGFFTPILYGGVLGLLLFAFVYIATKRSGKLYTAPIVTFVTAFISTVYGLFMVGGFEGMAYGILGIGFLLAGLVGMLFIAIVSRKGTRQKDFSKRDIWGMFLLPLVAIIVVLTISLINKPYWIIEEGVYAPEESVSHYDTSTISEGKKKISVRLGKEYIGKYIEVEKVKHLGRTLVILDIKDNGEPEKSPYLDIGLDEIHDPLTVRLTGGEEINPQ